MIGRPSSEKGIMPDQVRLIDSSPSIGRTSLAWPKFTSTPPASTV